MLINNGHNPNIIKSKGQLLKEAEKKIKQYEEEAKVGVAQIEELKWMCARQRVAIMALGEHFKLSPDDMKAIVQPKFDAELEETRKGVEAMKTQFKEDLKNGKAPGFTVIDNPSLEGK